ncbi:MAG: type VI secretion system protein ImpK [Blastocatellia bacterium]|nr:MAG: type VI secretion system protein ImpK [Blastocatellia bacterium]
MSAVVEPTVGSRRRSRSGSDFTSLAAPVLKLVLKLRAETLVPTPELRPTVHTLLQEMEQRAAKLRYPDKQIKDVKFALAAFVDETVLNVNSPLLEEWEKFPLQLEYFGEHLAGVNFFEKLNGLIRDIKAEVDVVEIYYLCLLLGFKGKYKVYMEDELQDLIKNTAAHLRQVGRLQQADLSPHWQVNDQPPPRVDPGLPLWFKIGTAVVIFICAMIYLVLFLVNFFDIQAAIERLLT